MGLKPRKELRKKARGGADPYAAGAGVLKQRESSDGKYAAGCQKNFLKRGSGKAMSSRASKLAQNKLKVRVRTKSTPTQAATGQRKAQGRQQPPTPQQPQQPQQSPQSPKQSPQQPRGKSVDRRMTEEDRTEQRRDVARAQRMLAVEARMKQLNK